MATLQTWALTTVADVKELLGIDAGNTTKNNLIIRKINQATAIIERYCGKGPDEHFASTTYTNQEYDSPQTDQLVLRNRPITAISSFQYRDTSDNTDNWTTFESVDWFNNSGSLPAGVIDLTFRLWGGYNSYRISYTAGYTTIPDDLAEAAAMLAAYLVDNPTTGAGVKSKQQGPKKIEYFEGQVSQSLVEQLGLDETLDSYRYIPINPGK